MSPERGYAIAKALNPPPVNNKTGYAAHPQLLVDKDGEKLVVIVKGTFEMPAHGLEPLELAPKERRRGIRFADVPWDPKKPEKSSIAYPGDLCLRKPGTDIVVLATAYAPGGEPTSSFEAFVKVGSAGKLLRIHGLRVWQRRGEGIGAARPITELPVLYEYAWGGVDESDAEARLEEARNPAGMGLVRDPAALTDQRAPQIEDPAAPVLTWRTRPPPAGLGAIGRHWEPRRSFAGTYDAMWLDLRAPLTPLDQDDRFHLCASPGLTAWPPLKGGEAVLTQNLVPGGGPFTLALPAVRVDIEFRVKGRETVAMQPPIDTALIDLFGIGPHHPIAIELVWRAFVKAPRKMSDASIAIRELRP